MTAGFDWQTRVGDVWAAEWRRTDRSFAGLSPYLDAAIQAAAPHCGTALDIGCGAGSTALALAAARPDVRVYGVDLSPALVEVARARGLDAHPGDAVDRAETLRLDLLVSRHGVMFFADPHAAFGRLRAGVEPGAPLVFSCFRDRSLNVWADHLVTAVTGARPADPPGYTPGPFAFADRAFVSDLLARSGWTDVAAEPVDFLYTAGEGDDPVADAADFLSRIGPVASAIRAAADPARLRSRLRDVLASYRIDTAVRFPAAAWIWRAQAGDTA